MPETTERVKCSVVISCGIYPYCTVHCLMVFFLFLAVQAKAVIRELLPGGLRESISKVRSSVAYAISAIAHWDWPEAWPQLFSLLMEMLVSGDVNAVHGAMRVLTGIEPSKLKLLFFNQYLATGTLQSVRIFVLLSRDF